MPALMHLTNDDWLACEQEYCSRHLSNFVERAWHIIEPGQPYIHGWHIDAVAEHLMAITAAELNRLLVNIPPGTMKSLLTSVFWPAWEWGPKRMESIRFIGAAHEEGLATRDNIRMRRLIESDWYQSLWPTSLVSDQNQKTYFENAKTGWRQSCPVKSMTGKRGDRVLWDDPHSVELAYSQAHLETATRVFRETLPTRLNNPDRSAVVVVMQRLNEQDVSGLILANDFGYEHLCLPMEYESKRAKTTCIGFKDPRTEEGELLFPERFPREIVDRDKKILGQYAVAGQFQQAPSPMGGGILKDEWWRLSKIIPPVEYRMIYADTAQKEKEHNDYSVFECWAKLKDGRIMLIDLLRGKWEAPELQTMARAFWNKHVSVKGQGKLRAMKVEDKSSGTGLIQQLKRGDDKHSPIPVKGIPREKDKVVRCMDIAPTVEAGMVLLLEDAPWLSDFMHECSHFPNGANDDMLDPAMDAINEMAGIKTTNKTAGVW